MCYQQYDLLAEVTLRLVLGTLEKNSGKFHVETNLTTDRSQQV